MKNARVCPKGTKKVENRCVGADKVYTINWTESHNPQNWGDNIKEGLFNIKQNLPKTYTYRREPDGWYKFDVTDKFVANSVKEAREIINNMYGDLEAYNVSRKGKLVFTEET